MHGDWGEMNEVGAAAEGGPVAVRVTMVPTAVETVDPGAAVSLKSWKSTRRHFVINSCREDSKHSWIDKFSVRSVRTMSVVICQRCKPASFWTV